ncbi:MAG: TOBE domain-containing protein, partial [Pseudomonadota bacterium]
RVGQRACAAIRPEKIAIGIPPAAGDNTLTGEVFDIAYMGDYTLYRVKLPTGALMEASRFNRRRRDDAPITWHDTVTLSFDATDAVMLTR